MNTSCTPLWHHFRSHIGPEVGRFAVVKSYLVQEMITCQVDNFSYQVFNNNWIALLADFQSDF